MSFAAKGRLTQDVNFALRNAIPIGAGGRMELEVSVRNVSIALIIDHIIKRL